VRFGVANTRNCPTRTEGRAHPHCSEPVPTSSCCSQMRVLYLAERQVSVERVYPVRIGSDLAQFGTQPATGSGRPRIRRYRYSD
jgi:hypothetical protein